MANKVCPKCKGSGFVYSASLLEGGEFCSCTMDRLRLSNMEKIWRSLSKIPITRDLRAAAPLSEFIGTNLLISATTGDFQRHLKAVAYGQSPMWSCMVRSDAEILDAWFGTAKAEGVKIFDMEIETSTPKAIDIPSLIGDWALVVLVLGVKRLPNREAPNALLEAISYREHEGKPTWVVEQPNHPVRSSHHLCYSPEVDAFLSAWKQIDLVGDVVQVAGGIPAQPVVMPNFYPTGPIVQRVVEEVTEQPERSSGTTDLLASLMSEAPAKKKQSRLKRKP